MRHEPMRDDPCVPVRTWLRPSTYRELTGHARRRGMNLDVLLSKLADASLHPVDWPGDQTVKPTRKPRRVLTADELEQAQAMRGAGETLAAIAERFDISVASASRNTKGAA